MSYSPVSAPLPQQPAAMRYAMFLNWGSRLGLAALALSFTAYLFGLLPPHVPLEHLPSVWKLPAATYLQLTSTPTGWGWLNLVHKGDLVNLIGIALLAGCSIPPLLAVIPLFLKRRDFAFAGICALIVCVLMLAASGILYTGH